MRISRTAAVCVVANAAALAVLAAYFFFVPGVLVVRDVRDPALSRDAVPRAAWRLFHFLTPRYERWAGTRIASGRAADRPVTDISGTEWPVFGSMFYLWSVESLQAAWEKDPSVAPVEPRAYARGAVEAAKDLIIDPASAGWVRTYWGDDYLSREDVFYRMLVIGALTTHHRLTGETRHLAMLRGQVESLAAELDASPTGQLDDYPGQCYTTDVVAAIAMIRRADAVLGTDHSAFVARERRGFEGKCLDTLGLVPFQSDSRTGETVDAGRGSSNSYLCVFAPELWPDKGKTWYDIYGRNFWQGRWGAAGFREFAQRGRGGDWYLDVDSGPVVAGFGVSACAFGVGASRANGRFDHARPLAQEMVAASWPLPGGTLLLPRMLSNATDAPLVGEAAILFVLTRRPTVQASVEAAAGTPGVVYALAAGYFAAAAVLVFWAAVRVRGLRRLRTGPPPAMGVQFVLWLVLGLGGAWTAASGSTLAGLVMLLVALLLPVDRRRVQKKGA